MDTMEIDKSSVVYLKKYLFLRLRDACLAYKDRRWDLHHYTTWACAHEVLLVVFRLGIMTPPTYRRIETLMKVWE